MSFQKIDEALDKAFELIESDRLEEARAILKPILDTEKNNPDVWWLYAHSVTDAETARLALNNVQRLDPNYLNTSDLLYALENRSVLGISGSESSDKEPSFLPPLPSTLPDLPKTEIESDDDEDWDVFDEEKEPYGAPLWRRPVFLLAAGLLIFVVIAALVIFSPQAPSLTVTETVLPTNAESVAQIPTVETVPPTMESVTQISASPVPTVTSSENGGDLGNLSVALSAFELPDESISTEISSLGNTLVVSVCSEAGAKLRQTLPLVIDAVATQLPAILEGQDGVAIRMLDCEAGTTLLFIGVQSEDAQAYAGGNLEKSLFHAKWQTLS